MKLLFVFILFTSGLFLSAKDFNADTLSVKKVLEIASENNPDLIMKKQRILSAKKNIQINASPDKPQFMFVREGIGNGNFTEQQLWISQYLDFPLKTFASVSADKSIVKQLEEEYKALQLDVTSEIKKAYTDIAYTIRLIELKKKQMNLLDSLRIITQIKLEAGMATMMDLMKSEILLEQLKYELKDAQTKLHTARYALFTIIGLDPEKQKYDIVFTDSLHFKNVDVNQQYVLSKIKNYPSYNANLFVTEQLEKRKKAVYYDLFPDFNLSYYKQNVGGGYNFYGYEFGLSIPLWFAFDQSDRLQQLEIEKTATYSQQNKLLLEIKRDIEYAWHGYFESRNKMNIYIEKILPKSNELMRLNLIAYREGQIELLQFLDTQRMHIENEIKYYDELRNYYIQLIELEKYLETELIFETK